LTLDSLAETNRIRLLEALGRSSSGQSPEEMTNVLLEDGIRVAICFGTLITRRQENSLLCINTAWVVSNHINFERVAEGKWRIISRSSISAYNCAVSVAYLGHT